MKLGDVIHGLRKKAGLSQVQLAEKAKVAQQTIGKIENHKAHKPRNLPSIANALGTNVEAILKQVTEEPTKQAPRPRSKGKSRAHWPFEFKFSLYAKLSEKHQETAAVELYRLLKRLASQQSNDDEQGSARTQERQELQPDRDRPTSVLKKR